MKTGDYVRTDKGLIGKVIKKEEYDTYNILEYEGQYCKRVLSTTGTDSEVIKSSPNIIDLIEEHDFVQMEDRGNRFYEIEKDYTDKLSLKDIGWDEYEELDETNIPEIKSIITHEQMESMKYKVKEEIK